MERWLDVVGYEGIYQVSSLGRIQRLDTKTILKPYADKDGYLHVVLYKKGKGTNRRVHRIACEAFEGPISFVGAQALHRDGDNTNNVPSNLYWGTHKQNMLDQKRHNAQARVNLIQGS